MSDDRCPLPPDLQQWIAEAGGYTRIDWRAWDAAVAAWREAYSRFHGGPISDAERREHARKHHTSRRKAARS